MVLLFWAALAVICATECATRRILCNRTSRSFPCRELLIPKSCYYARIEQRTHKLRSDTSNKRDSCKLKSLAPLHNPSLPIISDLTTQKERKLNSQLFLLNAQGGRAVMLLGTGACRTEISSVRTVLLGGGLENRLV